MLNTLANHGYLPRDGKAITKELTVSALNTALNFDATFVERLFQFAISTNPEPNATTYSLESLRTHNILEHDASLTYVTSSRSDTRAHLHMQPKY